MDTISYSLFICFLIPMVLSLFILEKGSRRAVGFILVGATVCLFISEVNGVLYQILNKDMLYYCTKISPVTEEIVKALPVLFYAIFFSDNRRKVTQVALATGLGFAILENMVMLVQNINDIDIPWAIVRGLGAGMMHSVCTMVVGIGISFVRKRKKMFYTGTTALMMMAITYHAIYNTIVMSPYKYYGVSLPIFSYIVLTIVFKRSSKK